MKINLIVPLISVLLISCSKEEDKTIDPCFNGVQDQTEEGIDCGEVCFCNCFLEPTCNPPNDQISIEDLFDYEVEHQDLGFHGTYHRDMDDGKHYQYVNISNDDYEIEIRTHVQTPLETASQVFELQHPSSYKDYEIGEMSMRVKTKNQWFNVSYWSQSGTAYWKVVDNHVVLSICSAYFSQLSGNEAHKGMGEIVFKLY